MHPLIQPLLDLSDYLGLLALIFLPLELWRRWRRSELRWSTLWEMLANLSPLGPVLVLNGVVLAFIIGLYTWVSKYALWSLPVNLGTLFTCIILVDFMYYVDHRTGHRLRLYWAISHSVHHSSPQYDQTTALRISFVDGFLSPWFYLPVVLLGFDPILVLASFGFILAYQQWIHTETIDKLPLIEGILNTPSAHRVHHGTQPQYLDKNYGAILMLWDRLFGTYQAEGEPVIYGLTTQINSRNPWSVHLCETLRLWGELKATTSWRARLKLVLYQPSNQSAQEQL
jgi:sterol desaturase/sphingolipid hydroxylase (fatty acid hydroxylase superfamily)